MIRIAVIGAGLHCCQNHLPALRMYADLHPGELALAGLCDVDEPRASQAASRFGFECSYTNYDLMLRELRPDAVVATTPVAATASIASDIISRRIPLLMEKPLAATLDDAQRLVALYERTKSPVMVSMNRRFEPVVRAGKAFLELHPFRRLHVTFARHNRMEEGFISETGIHAIDIACYLADSPPVRVAVTPIQAKDAGWALVRVEFASGALATLDLIPTCGTVAEQYDCFGDGCRLTIRSAQFDSGTVVGTENGKTVLALAPASTDLPFVRNGTFAETEAFINGLASGKPFSPNPSDTLVATRIAYTAVMTVPQCIELA